jgi:hypothetical protein
MSVRKLGVHEFDSVLAVGVSSDGATIAFGSWILVRVWRKFSLAKSAEKAPLVVPNNVSACRDQPAGDRGQTFWLPG